VVSGGRRFRNTAGTSTAAVVGIIPTASRPRISPVAAATSARARSAALRHSRAAGSSAAPAGVNASDLLVPWKSRAPNSCSSFAIWWLEADCTTKHRSAARVKLPSSATATTYLSCRRSTSAIVNHDQSHDNNALESSLSMPQAGGPCEPPPPAKPRNDRLGTRVDNGQTLMTMIHRGLPTAELRDEHQAGVPDAFTRLEQAIRDSRR
jgi:hypothetical protein